jgi:hypothetical protein
MIYICIKKQYILLNNMEKINNKPLIISLIKDDLINSKLISGLENLGIDAGLYLLGISDAIFVLLSIDDTKQSEDLFEYYLQLREKTQNINLAVSYEALNVLAEEIYEKMVDRLEGYRVNM